MLNSQIYIGADSQLNGSTKNVSMGQMKSIQLGGISEVLCFIFMDSRLVNM